jgi:hypothetical protein
MSDFFSISLENYSEGDNQIRTNPDIFDELEDDNTKAIFMRRHNNTPVSDNKYSNSDNHNNCIHMYRDLGVKLYPIPPRKSRDARNIWKQARIPSLAPYHEIESNLAIWAHSHAEIIQKDGNTTINWKSNSGTHFTSPWKTFVKWIICATHP